jgi:hypothetical protein
MRRGSPRSSRRRLVAAVAAGALSLAACGGESTGDGASAADPPGGTEAPPPPDDVELDPASDTATNQLPDVVVDDLIAGNKVNLRNFAPADTAILLWMWAPY